MSERLSTSIVLGMATCAVYTLYIKNACLHRQIMTMKESKSRRSKKGVETNVADSTESISPLARTAGSESDFTMKEIGKITSPYPQRAGTPRQGLIAKHSRSILMLHDGIAKECIEDLPQYSHVWVIFQFHLNPIGKGKDKNAPRTQKQANINRSNRASSFQFGASKIRPPRANGKKVGIFATRSPHRPNNVGLSLAMVEEVTTINIVEHQGKKKKIRKQTVLKLLGLDLVDGTPIYDIKPMCPSDIIQAKDLKVPSWVSADDELSAVEWTKEAKETVRQHQKIGLLQPLYPANPKRGEENEVIQAISEIVAQDPRAQHEGRGNATDARSTYEITFSVLRVKFQVEPSGSNSEGKHQAKIIEILRDEGDENAQPGSYQHSLGMRRKAERDAISKGVKLYWKFPVREGITTGLFELRDGTNYDDKML